MGKKAAALGLNASDLARTHGQAMSLVGNKRSPAHPNEPNIAPAVHFYTEALAPLEQAREVELRKLLQAKSKLERKLQKEFKQQNKLLAESQSTLR